MSELGGYEPGEHERSGLKVEDRDPDVTAAWDELKELNDKLHQGVFDDKQRTALEDQLNRCVAALVEMEEVEAEDAWSLSIGHNPYLDDDVEQREL